MSGVKASDSRSAPHPSQEDAGPAPAQPPGPDVFSRTELVEALFREHNQSLVRFLSARLSSYAEAKEVAQEAYVRLLQLDQPEPGGFLRALLFKTAANIATDRIRRRRFDRESMSQDPLGFGLGIEERSPESRAASAEEIEIVSRCLAELSPRCRQAVFMSRLQGKSSAEIASVLKVSTRMVRMYITEASLLIRDRLRSAHTRRAAPQSRQGGRE